MRKPKSIVWAWLAAVICLLGLAAVPSSAYAAPLGNSVHAVNHVKIGHVNNGYTHTVSSATSDGCAKFSGDISVGIQTTGRLREGYIDLNGTLSSHCTGTATLYINYATDGGTPIQAVVATTSNSSSKSISENPYKEQAKVSYNDVYIYVCTNHNGFRCGNNSG